LRQCGRPRRGLRARDEDVPVAAKFHGDRDILDLEGLPYYL
jgi:hypothetical protein